jgi:anti-sigma-K factor RskA
MTHEEASELLGAFALDAVEADDVAAIREHLDSCMRCEREVAQFHEVAGLMANTGGNAPQHLWERIAEQVETVASETSGSSGSSGSSGGPEQGGGDADDVSVVKMFRPPPAGRTRSARSAGWRSRGLRFVVPLGTAAALIVIAVLGLQIDHMNHRIGQLDAISADQGLSQAVQAALLDPQAKQVELTSITIGSHGGSSALADLVVLPSGSGFLLNNKLPVLPSGETYQLWGQSGGLMISIGLLGSRPTDVAMTIGQPASFAAYAVTVEHTGGSVAPTLPPVAASAALST